MASGGHPTVATFRSLNGDSCYHVLTFLDFDEMCRVHTVSQAVAQAGGKALGTLDHLDIRAKFTAEDDAVDAVPSPEKLASIMGRCPRITRFTTNCNNIIDVRHIAVIVEFAKDKLRSLDLGRCVIDDDSLELISQCQSLQHLSFFNTWRNR